MENTIKNYFYKTLTFFVIILSLAVLSWAYLNYRQAQSILNPQRTITFTQEGRVFAKPDVAKVTFSIITQAKTAEDAQKENDQRMTQLLEFIKKEGVKSEDIKTIGYYLNPQYDYNWCKTKNTDIISCPPKIVSYQLNQTVEIKIRNFDKINTIVGGLSENGANEISQVSFEIDDIEDYKNLARIDALNKIEKRAKLISQKTFVKLGRIISISENTESTPFYRAVLPQTVLKEKVVNEANIEPGVNEIKVVLTVLYEIK